MKTKSDLERVLEGGKFAGEAVSRLDEESLSAIAINTGGNYYQTPDIKTLEESYIKIARLSRQKVSLDASAIFMVVALLILFIEWALMNTKYRILP